MACERERGKTMTWMPFSVDEVAALVVADQAEFSADEQTKFARVRVPITKVRCHRSEELGDDGLFVVANDGVTAIIFDDVEEEFGICKSTALEGDIVRAWSLAGSLVFALMHLK